MPVSEAALAILEELGGKYVWWKPAAEAIEYPERVAAQVMNLGDYADVQRIGDVFGDDFLREILAHAEIGQFTPRSWAYWHYRLGLAEPEGVPPMPERKIA
jgi:hypothetical protein